MSHVRRIWTSGPGDPTPDEDIARFWSKVPGTMPGECWPWQGTINNGYGHFNIQRDRSKFTVKAHRIAYELVVGPIPEGLTIDHLCRNKVCMNPAHMEPVTHGENARRRNAAQTHCIHGHAYTPENTYINPKGARVCRTCKNANTRAAYWRGRRETNEKDLREAA